MTTFDLMSHSKNYLSATLIITGVSFFTLPILTRLLTPFDYGIISLFTSVTSIFSTLFLLGISGSIKVNCIKKDFPHREYLFSNLMFLLSINIIFVIIISYIKNTMGLMFNLSSYIIILASLTSVGNVFVRTKLDLLQGLRKSKQRSAIETIKQVGTVLFSILVIYLMKENVYYGWSKHLC